MSEKKQVLICSGAECSNITKPEELKNKFQEEINRLGLNDQVDISLTGCFGLCAKGAIVNIQPGNILYGHVKSEDIAEICEKHLKQGTIVERLQIKQASKPIKENKGDAPVINHYGNIEPVEKGVKLTEIGNVVLGGKVKKPGLYNIPAGTTLREIIFHYGGGMSTRRKFKAALIGGFTGTCISEADLDQIVDFKKIMAFKSLFEASGILVLDEDNCMVDVARMQLEYTIDKTCGKCTPCRDGLPEILELLENIQAGKAKIQDIKDIEKLGVMIEKTSLCRIGQVGPDIVLSIISKFRDEFEAHVKDGYCPAGMCKELTHLFITDACIGCTKCARNCPVEAISGLPKQHHTIDLDICINCGTCKAGCPVGAIISKPLGKEAL